LILTGRIPTKAERDEFMEFACEVFEPLGYEHQLRIFVSNHSAFEFMFRVEIEEPRYVIDERIPLEVMMSNSREGWRKIVEQVVERLVSRAKNVRFEIAEREFAGLEGVLDAE